MPLLTHGRVCPSGPAGGFMATGAPAPALLYIVPAVASIKSPIVTSSDRVCGTPVTPIASCSRPGPTSHCVQADLQVHLLVGRVGVADRRQRGRIGPRWSSGTRRSG